MQTYHLGENQEYFSLFPGEALRGERVIKHTGPAPGFEPINKEELEFLETVTRPTITQPLLQ